MNSKTILYTVGALLLSSLVFFVGYEKSYDPKEIYKVYLDGKVIGFIESKEELESYIDKEEATIKKKYGVDKVYIPNNLDITKEITYTGKIKSAKSIYEEIKKKAAFTIEGYKITIKGVEEITETGPVMTDEVVVNVLDKEIFVESVNNTITAFVEQESYEAFLSNKQEEIKDTGTLIEDVYIQNDIIIKETRISTKEQIFMTSEDLSKYLLFGTLKEQQKYTVKAGDTIESVAFNNKLSVGEFLIANEQFTGADNLLYPGQKVTLGIIKPAFNVVEEDHVVTIEEDRYEIIYEDDNNLAIGTEIIKQKGENGTLRVTRKIKKSNGIITGAVPYSEEVIKPSVAQVVVRGQKYISGVANNKKWYWPTARPYIITSPYGWRWGKMHEGLDISGTGRGSPIYSINNGVVVKASWTNTNGWYVYVNHNNGYYSVYGHMDYLNVKEGQIVEGGHVLGGMGDTGYSTGVHLHISISYGYPYRGGSYFINPMRLLG